MSDQEVIERAAEVIYDRWLKSACVDGVWVTTVDGPPNADAYDIARALADANLLAGGVPGRSEAEIKAEALQEFKTEDLPDFAMAMGSDLGWYTTGSKVAALVGEWLDDRAARVAGTTEAGDDRG